MSDSLASGEVRDANGVPQEASNVNIRDGYAAVGLARSFCYEKLFLGASVRGVSEYIAGTAESTLAMDFGAILKPTNERL